MRSLIRTIHDTHISATSSMAGVAAAAALMLFGCVAEGTSDSDASPAEVSGCQGSTLYELPSYDQPGPWPVGVRTLSVQGLTVEVFYPGKRGSEAGKQRVSYDLRAWLPAAERDKIPDEAAPSQQCDCHRDLELDDIRGPYPVVFFIHGTAAFRTQSLAQLTHWASRGFIVVSADHPNIFLGDALQLKLGANQAGDVRTIAAALRAAQDGFDFLNGRADLSQMAATGHSAGGSACKSLGDIDGMRVLMPMAAGGVDPAKPVDSTLVLLGDADITVAPDNTIEGYETSVGNKRLVALAGAGHLVFSQLCEIAGDAGDLYSLALQWDITIPPGTGPLFKQLATDGCLPGQFKGVAATPIINRVTSAVLEETLRCQALEPDPLAGIAESDPNVSRYERDAPNPAGED